MDAPQFNGEPGPEHDPGRSNGQPEPWKCLDCPVGGRGFVKRSRHWYQTEHRIVWAGDPRAAGAPHVVREADPARACMPFDGQGRR